MLMTDIIQNIIFHLRVRRNIQFSQIKEKSELKRKRKARKWHEGWWEIDNN